MTSYRQRIAAVALGALTVVLAPSVLATAGAAQAGAAPAAAPPSLTVMDWNMNGANSAYDGPEWSKLVEFVRLENPDVLTLQELHQDKGVTITKSGKTYPGINQLDKLVAAFPQFANSGSTYHNVVARSDRNGEGGVNENVILSRYPIVQRFAAIMPNTSGGGKCSTSVDHGYPADGCAVNRSFAGAQLNVDGSAVRVYTAHFTAGTSQPAHTAQAQWVAAHLRTPSITSPFVFTGDLNMHPDDSALHAIAAVGVYDAWTNLHDNIAKGSATEVGHVPGGAIDPNNRIDYSWTSPALDTTSVRLTNLPAVNGTLLSDHKAIFSTMTIHSPGVRKAATVDAPYGWANFSVDSTGKGTLHVCDQLPDGKGVVASVHPQGSAVLLGTYHDDAYATGCGRTTFAGATSTSFTLKICQNNAGTAVNCVTKDV